MKRFGLFIAILATLVAAPLFPAAAQSNQITLQGVLTTGNGVLVSGAHDMTFNFYDDAGADAPVFTITQDGVAVENGLYNVVIDFGQAQPAKDFAALWLGVAVGEEAEFDRIPLTSVLYAIRAQVADTAKALDCEGCVGAGMLDFDPVTEGELTSGDLVIDGALTASAFIGDGSALTGIVTPLGSCAEDWFVAAIEADGSLVCKEVPPTVTSIDGLGGGTIDGDVEVTGMLTVAGQEACHIGGNCGETLWQLLCEADQVPVYNGQSWACGETVTNIKPEDLPPDGLNEVSNELLTNQFTDTFTSATTPLDIKDFYPPGVTDSLVVEDVGVAQDLTVSINVTNSDLSTVDVYLYDPEGTEYVLYQKNGPGQELGATYPVPTQPVSGDLASWIGKNPKGTWLLKVVDSGFLDQPTDGAINSWSIQVKTLSTKKVQVNGDLVVTGNITSAGGDGITIDDSGNVNISGDLNVVGALTGVDFKIDCTTVSSSSGGQTVSVQCPAGYMMTGGGCACTPGSNGSMWNSYPDGNGWYCYESSTSVTAYARCCRILPNQAQ
jgi:subtilisin-like proprotein convertase family protein